LEDGLQVWGLVPGQTLHKTPNDPAPPHARTQHSAAADLEWGAGAGCDLVLGAGCREFVARHPTQDLFCPPGYANGKKGGMSCVLRVLMSVKRPLLSFWCNKQDKSTHAQPPAPWCC
jgi:hypothetical protein